MGTTYVLYNALTVLLRLFGPDRKYETPSHNLYLKPTYGPHTDTRISVRHKLEHIFFMSCFYSSNYFSYGHAYQTCRVPYNNTLLHGHD